MTFLIIWERTTRNNCLISRDGGKFYNFQIKLNCQIERAALYCRSWSRRSNWSSRNNEVVDGINRNNVAIDPEVNSSLMNISKLMILISNIIETFTKQLRKLYIEHTTYNNRWQNRFKNSEIRTEYIYL